MKSLYIAAAGSVLALFAASTPALAQDCSFDIEIPDFEQADIDRLYACVNDRLPEAYGKEGHEIGSVYRSWQPAATGPAAPGPHSNRFLFTYANEIAYSDYVRYPYDDDFSMPVGSVLAKESWSLNKEGAPRLGPLFIMTKVAAGEADDFDNWVYSAVRTNGKPMEVSQSFCHDCHVAFEGQDSLGYPAFDVQFEVN